MSLRKEIEFIFLHFRKSIWAEKPGRERINSPPGLAADGEIDWAEVLSVFEAIDWAKVLSVFEVLPVEATF